MAANMRIADSSSAPISSEYPATSAARIAARRRWTGCFINLPLPRPMLAQRQTLVSSGRMADAARTGSLPRRHRSRCGGSRWGGDCADRWRRFDKGRHPAGPNYGDRFASVLAKIRRLSLMLEGRDFARTDIETVIFAGAKTDPG